MIRDERKGEKSIVKYKEIRENKEINAYLKKGDANLGLLGFTDPFPGALCACGASGREDPGTVRVFRA